jgi:hypothetical protein
LRGADVIHPTARPFLAAALAGAWVLVAEAAGTDLAATFARRFLAAEHEANLSGMTPEMQAASGPEASERLRSELLARNGSVTRIGEAWLEDTVHGYRRYRVGVEFEKAALDFRVVLDAEDRIAGFFIVPHAEAPSARPAVEAPGPQIEVRIGAGDRALPGTLSLPRGAGPFAAVVLVHGSGPQDRDETIGPNKPLRDLAFGLAERGIAALRYDKRSFARPGDLQQAGSALTVHEEVIEDALAALDVLRGREEIDGKRLFVLGHSLGGSLAPRIAAAEPRPAGTISLAGSTLPLPEKMLEQLRYIAALDGTVTEQEGSQVQEVEAAVKTIRSVLRGERPDPGGTLLGAPIGYFADLEAHDPPAVAAALGLPVLVLQGTHDYQVTIQDFERWQRGLEGKPFACLASYDGLDHLFREGRGQPGPQDYDRAGPVASRVLDDLAGWIKERRCPGRRAAGSDAPSGGSR